MPAVSNPCLAHPHEQDKPAHHHRKPLQLRSQNSLGWVLILELLGRLALVHIMQFPASVPARALPGSDAAWARAAQQTRGYHYAAWGPDVLVDVHITKIADALPALDFVFGVGGRRRIHLCVIVFFLGRLG